MEDIDAQLSILKEIRDYIHKESGIFFPDNKLYQLENKINERITQLKQIRDLKQYFLFIRYNSDRILELNNLFDLITVSETTFFRNHPQLSVFQNEILPILINQNIKKSNPELNIWSAGCATGEEPYTLAILLMEKLGININKWNIKILASDISPSSLHTAEQGIYNFYSLRDTPAEYINKYFIKQGKDFVIKEKLKKLVRFTLINLNNPFRLKLLPQMDIIFCRNVLIYFNTESKKKVISSFYDRLKKDGHLFLGHSESLYAISQEFKALCFKDVVVYQSVK